MHHVFHRLIDGFTAQAVRPSLTNQSLGDFSLLKSLCRFDLFLHFDFASRYNTKQYKNADSLRGIMDLKLYRSLFCGKIFDSF